MEEEQQGRGGEEGEVDARGGKGRGGESDREKRWRRGRDKGLGERGGIGLKLRGRGDAENGGRRGVWGLGKGL